MKWKQCKKGDIWHRYDAWIGRKNGWSFEISGAGPSYPKGTYYFITHRKDGEAYNSLWKSKPYPSVEIAQVEAESYANENR